MTLIGVALQAMFRSRRCRGGRLEWALGLLIAGLGASDCHGQVFQNPGGGAVLSPSDVPQTRLTPVPQHPAAPPPSGFHSPLYDPYSSNPGAGAYAPAVPGMAPLAPTLPSAGWGGPGFGDSHGQAGYGHPAYGAHGHGYGGPGYGTPMPPPSTFPPEAYPSGAPMTLFPGGIYGEGGWLSGVPLSGLAVTRFFQGPRLRHGWIRGGDGVKSVQMNETDASLVFAFSNFGYSGQPLYVAPSFGLTLLDGPDSASGADLPGQVYSAFLDTGWQSDPNQMLSVDLGLRMGVFSDFDAQSSDSFRILGRGLAHFRLSPFSTFKAGAYYLDRERVSWLPAFGLVYQPTPLARYDLFFPEPKFSRFCTTLGTHDVWSYVAGEYGGGTWTIRREAGDRDRVDINDIRVLLGLEWGRNDLLRQGRRTGFFEVGYVFNRELVYQRNPQDNIDPNDTIMLRLGIGY